MTRNRQNEARTADPDTQARPPAKTARRTILAIPLLAAFGAAATSPVAESTVEQAMAAGKTASSGTPNAPVQTAPVNVVAGPADLSRNPSLGVLFAAYARALTEPVGVLCLGSSTTAGVDEIPADRWVNKLCAAMQSRYASGPGRDSAPGHLDSPRNTLPGIHFYNAGKPGAKSNNYMTADMVDRIKALAPTVITHMVGSNDAKRDVPAATYRTDLLRSIDAIDAVLPQPHVHILILAHERSDKNITATWNAYRGVLQGIAHERPRNVAFVDISRAFEAVGFPKNDPMHFLKPGNVHLTPAGQDFTARVLAQELTATPRDTRIAISDSFARADGPLGSTDSGQRWIGSPGSVFVLYGKKACVTAGGSAVAESASPNVDASLNLAHTGEDNNLAGLLVRADPVSGAHIGVFISAGTEQQVSLHVNDGATDVEVWRERRAIAPGDHEVRLVAVGNTCVAYLDGALVKAVSLPPVAAAVAGNTGTGLGCRESTTAVSFGRFAVRDA